MTQSTPRVEEAGIAEKTHIPDWLRINRRYFLILTMGWTFCVAVSWRFHLADNVRQVERLSIQSAKSLFEKDVLYRRWNANRGGVYVFSDEKTPPNPHLNTSDRDIKTASGRVLTLVNPAYMTRQVHELQDNKLGIQGHITSLNPLRPENLPDDWESAALRTFESGVQETNAFTQIGDQRYARYMHPLFVEQGCLKCHDKQGYKLGDVRGGISITVPMALFNPAPLFKETLRMHIILWLIGLAGLIWGHYYLQHHLRKRQEAEVAKAKLIDSLQNALTEIKTMSGLIPICANCKNIRNDSGYWQRVENYVEQHSAATFSHGICPDCLNRAMDHLKQENAAEQNAARATGQGDWMSKTK